MEKFRVTKHFSVYGNRSKGGSRYNCKTCEWRGTTFESAQEHYMARHAGGTPEAVPAKEVELTPEEAVPALNYLARRVVELEDKAQALEGRNAELLKALESRNKQHLSDDFRKVYQPEMAKRG